MHIKMRSLIFLIYFIHSIDAFTVWTRDGLIQTLTHPEEVEVTLSTGKRIKYWRQAGNFLNDHAITLVDMTQSYFEIQKHCLSLGMQIFLPSNQDEVDEMAAEIPFTLIKDPETEQISEDIYSGLFVRLSDMDYEGCWKTTGTNGVDYPYSKMAEGTKCPIQAFPHILDNSILDDGYNGYSGEDFMMLAKDGKFYDVSHMVTILDGRYSSMLLSEQEEWMNEEFETPGSNAMHGLLTVCEDPTTSADPCNEDDYADDFCTGFQKDYKWANAEQDYDTAAATCAALGSDWQLWYPETKAEEEDTVGAIKQANMLEQSSMSFWVRDQGNFQCRYNQKGADPITSAGDHYMTSGDYTLAGDDGSSAQWVICEKVQDRYKSEREVCDILHEFPADVTGDIPIVNKDDVIRNLEFVGQTTYQRAHAICQSKGKQLFLPRDLAELNDVYQVFYNTTRFYDTMNFSNPAAFYFAENDFTDAGRRPAMWIRYTDQDSEHCWNSDDECNGAMLWTSWAYRWYHRRDFGYYPKGLLLDDTDLFSYSGRNDHTIFLHQPDNWGVTKSQLVQYARRFNEYGQQYAAIEGVTKVAEKPQGAKFNWKPYNKNLGYPDFGTEPFYGLMHDTYNTYKRGFGFCEDKAVTCEEMNIIDDSTCMDRSILSTAVKKLDSQMTYAAGKQACKDLDMIIWMPDNVVEQNTAASELNLVPGDEVWLRLTFDDGDSPSCSDDACTSTSCCCPNSNEDECNAQVFMNWKKKPLQDNVGTWRIDWAETNSIYELDPSPTYADFATDPPTCRSTSKYYHWATDEPKMFKALSKYHRNPTADEKLLKYAAYSHTHSGISDGTSKDVNGDWVSRTATDVAWVLCQTRDHWKHHVVKQCDIDSLFDPNKPFWPAG